MAEAKTSPVDDLLRLADMLEQSAAMLRVTVKEFRAGKEGGDDDGSVWRRPDRPPG